jgi:dCMP deaminase
MNNFHNRKNPESLFMTWAWDLSNNSSDSRKYGALITNNAMTKVLSMGWNGGATGLSDKPASFESGESALIHAELNALLRLQSDLRGNKLFTTHSPCKMCAKAIVNAGIWAVYYAIDANPEGLAILKAANIRIIQMEKL